MTDTPSKFKTERHAGFQVDAPLFLIGFSGRLVRLSLFAAGLPILTGVAVLVGYVLRWKLAVRLYPSLPPMYPNTAVGFIVGGLSVMWIVSSRRVVRLAALLGFAVIVMGSAVTLGLHFADAGPTWLEALWPKRLFILPTTPVAGRPAAETCLAFLCVGTSGALTVVHRAPRLRQGLALGTMSVGAAVCIGYAIGVDRKALGTTFIAVGMALHTAVAMLALGAATMLVQPTTGLFAGFTRSGLTAQLGRRLLLVVVVAPIALTAGTSSLVNALPDARLAQSVAVILQVVALGLLVMLPLNLAERAEQAAVEALNEARRSSEQVGEKDLVVASITDRLTVVPTAPAGWEVGFRQSAALASLPGDTGQLLERADGRCLLAVVDVAGHGTQAALQALQLRTEIAVLWRSGGTIDVIADVINHSVLDLATIATGVFIDLQTSTGECSYLNAGHPAVYHADDGLIEQWPATMALFGFDACIPISAQERQISCGAMIVAYTDGITEARSTDGQFLGERAIETALRRNVQEGPQAVADAFVDSALERSQRRLCDDALAIALQRR
jgi:Stage II sporulation protein E (SpoIIE)